MLLFGISFFNIYSILLFLMIIFIGTICSFHLYVSTFHGFRQIFYSFNSISLKEHLILLNHSLPIFCLFIFI
jgi:hypothetical protein